MYADDGMREQLDEAAAGPGESPAGDHEDALAEVDPIPTDDDVEEEEETSLEDLVARRSAPLGGGEEIEDDPPELIRLAPQPPVRAPDPVPTKVVPIRERREFVCNRCHLVKARSQLADHERGLCRDCV
ncbi:MAG: DUF4193 family protein [Actinomycetota bacterium]|nr:DUF4193 family protein [Actinomycetota bacterium]